MSYQPRHTFVDGATILGAQLATCTHCGTLRVTDAKKHPEPRYVLPGVSDELRRDGFEVPACISGEIEGARERAASMNRARAREQAIRAAKNAAPVEVAEEPRQVPLMLPHFPWYADMHRGTP